MWYLRRCWTVYFCYADDDLDRYGVRFEGHSFLVKCGKKKRNFSLSISMKYFGPMMQVFFRQASRPSREVFHGYTNERMVKDVYSSKRTH